MCGLPGSGKSSWAKNKCRELYDSGRGVTYICRDDIRSTVNNGYAYDLKTEPRVKKIAWDMFVEAYRSQRDIIIDEVHLTRAHRDKFLVTVHYKDQHKKGVDNERVVCVWAQETEKNLDRRMQDGRGYERDHWRIVIDQMRDQFEAPSEDEGFDEIIKI